MRPVVALLILALSSTASAQPPWSSSGGGSSGVEFNGESGFKELPTVRMLFGPNAEFGTATTVDGFHYDFRGGGFGFDVAFYLPLPWVQPYFRGNIDANIVGKDEPCRASPFDPNTLECSYAGGPGHILGGIQAGLRVVHMKDGKLGRVGLSLGAQYTIQGVSYEVEDENEVLPYAQIDYALSNAHVSFAAGFGGYFMGEYATPKKISIFRTVVLRVERWDWEREVSVVKGFNFHVLIGTLH